MAGDASTGAHLLAVLAALEESLARLAESRDAQSADLAHDMLKAIDKIRAELGQLQSKDAGPGTATSTAHQHRK
jgi:uncharacterized protein YicC (UPF0701 family)